MSDGLLLVQKKHFDDQRWRLSTAGLARKDPVVPEKDAQAPDKKSSSSTLPRVKNQAATAKQKMVPGVGGQEPKAAPTSPQKQIR